MKKKFTTTILALVFALLFIPQTAFAADPIEISYSGGTLLDNTATVSASRVGKLIELTKNPTSTEYVGAWSNWTYPETAQTGKSLTIPTGTKTWSNTYFIMRNALAVNGKNYDIKGTIEKSVNNRSGSVLLGKRSAIRNLDVRTDGTGTERTNGVFVSITYTISEAGTSTLLNLHELWFGFTDLDLLQSFGSQNMTLNSQTLLIKQKGDFTLNGEGNAYINNTGIYQSAYVNLPERGDFYVDITSLNSYNATYGFKQSAGSNIHFFTTQHTITYNSVNGSTSKASEKVLSGLNPTGAGNAPDANHYFVQWTTNQNVELTDGTEIANGQAITEEQIKKVVVTRDMSFTAYNEPYLNVSYEWTGEHPNKPVPAGKDDIKSGDTYTVDTTYKVGDTVEEPKGETPGIWTFKGWDESGDIEIIKNTVIKGTWEFTPYHSVTYQWDGEHPDKPIPEGKSEIPPETEYVVDTTYKAGDTVPETNVTYKGTTYPRGAWTFNGWDKNGTIVINQDEVIKGTWNFTPEWNIDTEAVNGTITESETNIPDGENRVITYTPSEGYQLYSLTVDGEEKDIKEHPMSYAFTGINADHTIKAVFERIPALDIEKSADKDVYNAGDTVTYTVKVRQTVEGAEARNVRVEDTLPEGVTLKEDSFSDNVKVVSADDHAYELYIPSLGEVTYTYTAETVKATDAEELINTVKASAENVPGDPVKDTAKVKALTPKPTIEKIVSNETPIHGEEITYTISVKEPQDGIVLRNAVVTDPIPEGIEADTESIVVTGNPGEVAFADNTLVVSIPELSTETVIQFNARVTAVNGEIDNVATLSGDDIEEISDNAKIAVTEPTPVLAKSVDKPEVKTGDTVKYTITASSPIPLLNATLVDKIPAGITVDESSITCDPEANVTVNGNEMTISAGTCSAITVTYSAKVTKAGEHKNTVTLSADNFPKGPISADAKTKATDPPKVQPKEKEPAEPSDDPDEPDEPDDEDEPEKKAPKTGQGFPWELLGFGLMAVLSGGYLIGYRKNNA